MSSGTLATLIRALILLLAASFALSDALDEAQDLLDKGILFAQRGMMAEAAPWFTKAAQKAPHNAQVQFNAGFASMQMGHLCERG